ncbi:similar to Saccharomyces cerevisiae YMR005W TAF4 TFIID subunit (48 kDa), involved in RNA polymerase II transcription initiation [Maudiozyma barnettii]|uniref:Transcription initiation factor TFIID subunit 4 n=1 Tax=Maudiozyma barnettii TaxID=61262 RepID=A0A8H2VHJ3_9SACH|nr:Taf4p [Kazachstania barnettii]CAB4255555.1 similar to Saccharomyces cerevisiae YMR005W TAF4 TFIID subunit (48 kDa), involved in RNA polymerase II transcription initiation [Kazachstania barnettii]CAD1784053.1 similar to Saccharomyces cerevisiae YMR005W TAF4 TFIID subunit (48 kDa), involved in RNA polymerase II transcription initiation [Kazachstania barnettii]
MSNTPSSSNAPVNDTIADTKDNIDDVKKRELENDTSNEPNKKVKLEEKSDSNGTTEVKSTNLALPKADEKKKTKKKESSSSKKKDNTSGQDSTKNSNNAQQKMDPNKMQDVLFSAGVDIREEEALLHSSINASKNAQAQNAVVAKLLKNPPFLHPDQVSKMMKRALINQNCKNVNEMVKNNDILSMMSSACESYMRDIITNAVVISRHRRKAVKINSGRRSEVATALRAIAIQQKKDEERRVKKRIALGLEKEDYENKIDSEETLHRASNVTAGLRAGSKKQYGWLTSSVGKPTNTGVKATGRVASDIAARGDSGLKYREAREEPGIVMRDLLNVLENRRMGVHNVISKGYARIRD